MVIFSAAMYSFAPIYAHLMGVKLGTKLLGSYFASSCSETADQRSSVRYGALFCLFMEALREYYRKKEKKLLHFLHNNLRIEKTRFLRRFGSTV